MAARCRSAVLARWIAADSRRITICRPVSLLAPLLVAVDPDNLPIRIQLQRSV